MRYREAQNANDKAREPLDVLIIFLSKSSEFSFGVGKSRNRIAAAIAARDDIKNRPNTGENDCDELPLDGAGFGVAGFAAVVGLGAPDLVLLFAG